MSILPTQDKGQPINSKDNGPQAFIEQRHKVRSVFITQQLVMELWTSDPRGASCPIMSSHSCLSLRGSGVAGTTHFRYCAVSIT